MSFVTDNVRGTSVERARSYNIGYTGRCPFANQRGIVN